MNVEAVLSKLLNYSEELGLDVTKPEDRFKWFLAVILFAKRISVKIAKRTYLRFKEEELTTPDRISGCRMGQTGSSTGFRRLREIRLLHSHKPLENHGGSKGEV